VQSIRKKMLVSFKKKVTAESKSELTSLYPVLYGTPQSLSYICISAAILRHNGISEGGVSALKLHSLAYVD